MNKPQLTKAFLFSTVVAFEIKVPKIGPQLIYMDISIHPVNKPGYDTN